ncbi:hypothetical protein D3C81_1541110 [compost metagenome]
MMRLPPTAATNSVAAKARAACRTAWRARIAAGAVTWAAIAAALATAVVLAIAAARTGVAIVGVRATAPACPTGLGYPIVPGPPTGLALRTGPLAVVATVRSTA